MLKKSILGAIRECGYELFKAPKPAVDCEVVVASRDQPPNVLYECPWLSWLIPAALCIVMFGQLFFSGRQLSQTADEATHLYAGYRCLKCGDFTVSPEHPPFAKVIAAAPLLALNFKADCEPFKGDALQQAFASLTWLYSQNWPAALTSSRIAMSVFAVGLCLLVWIAALRMFGFSTAIVAGLLLIFEPNVLAYGALVLTDVPVTCMLLFAVFGFHQWIRHSTVPLLLLTAFATGLTLLTKHSGVVVVPILGALAITAAFAQAEGNRPTWQLAVRNLLSAALICSLAVGIVWLGYGMRFAAHSGAQIPPQRSFAPNAAGRLLFELETHHLLPQAYVEGVSAALALSSPGSVAFVAGKVYLRAPWFSTPFTFLIRNTTAMLAMIVLSVVGAASVFRKRRCEYLFLLVPMTVYLAVCIHAGSNVSIRYLLPLFPFLLIAVAAGCVELASNVRWVRYALPCLIALHAASSLRACPNYLSYANDLWGGPSQAFRYLPGLDLGQSYLQARTYLEKHPAQNCWLIAGWQWDPTLYDVPCQTFGLYLPHEIPSRVRGTVIVSSTLLTDVRLAEGSIAAPFRNATPTGHIGGSALLVYEGEFDTTVDAAAGESGVANREFSAGHASIAIEHAQRAVELAPASPLTHGSLCFLLAPTRVDSALKECSAAQSLLLQDPLLSERTRKQYLEILQSSIAALRSEYRIVYGYEPESLPSAASPRR
jgi:4-amino-4-deoxy-L-arabinose transferase-like glycosyltransferase